MDTPLKRVRKASGQTALHVAQSVAIDQSHYSRVENGDTGASAEVAARLAAHFEGKLSELEILYPERYVLASEAA